MTWRRFSTLLTGLSGTSRFAAAIAQRPADPTPNVAPDAGEAHVLSLWRNIGA
jgi:hypothetical protein